MPQPPLALKGPCMIYCHRCYPPRSSRATLIVFSPPSSGLWDSLDDVLSIAAHVTGEVGYKTRVSARLHPASLFYPIVRAPDYDVSLRRCTATHQHECFCVRHTPSHTASPDSVMTFFVHELPKNVGAISLAVMRGFCTPVHPLLVPSRLGDEGFVTGTLRIPPATNGEDVLSPSLWYINLHLSL